MSEGIPTKASLGCFRAVMWAVFGVPADFYPRVVENGAIVSFNSEAILKELGSSSDWANLTGKELDDALALAKQSMAEVKAQTEYQDSKATRILTVTTFLTAFSGVLFTRFEDSYQISDIPKLWLYHQYLVEAAYVTFGLMILMVLSGSLVIFHAIRTRFKYPDKHLADKQERDPKSLEFYAALIAVRPRAWMSAWVRNTSIAEQGGAVAIRDDLKGRYLHNLVGETYLIAAKTADKLRYLEPGQIILAWSLRLLFVWLLLFAWVTVAVPAIKKPPETTEVHLVGLRYPEQSAPIRQGSQPDNTPTTAKQPASGEHQ